MTRLTADELGEKGESRFRELCADGGLVCNKSERDRVGWDFTVDFGFRDQGNISLDKRLPPVSCQVQVKTIMSKNRTIRVRLNMAERLAKEIKPAFIFVLRVKEDKTFADAYLLHIYGDRLASILKRLRKETAAGTSQDKINRLEIALTVTDSEKINISGESLRMAIEQCCGFNIAQYSADKQEQQRKLGYEGAPFELITNFTASNLTELEEIFLGIRQNVEISAIETFETRFNIKLPLKRFPSAKLTIQAGSSNKCRITFRAFGIVPTSIDADIYAVPPMVMRHGRDRLRIKGQFFEIDAESQEKTTQIKMKALYPHNFRGTIEDWTTFHRIAQVCHLKGTIELERAGVPTVFLKLSDGPAQFTTNYAGPLALVEKVSEIVRHAGVDKNHIFELRDINEARDQIVMAHALLTGEVTSWSFSGKTEADFRDTEFPTIFLVSSFQIGTLHIGYHMKTTMSIKVNDAQTTVSLSEIYFREVRLLDGPEGRAVYIAKIKQQEDSAPVGEIEMLPTMETEQI
ncbi:hypothetical protein EUC41_10100 [Achromobacter denitrificans]|uniref:hypothetical protein n=1 Tax=Achromobacter denitrificans TaxID=32002 RepID=UPI000F4F68D1|nr:hypothetical protein [Achromobacter denitrificans]MBV2157542.1 hypothetical protein [Achromobacter denitrificans]MDX3881582.1 hypothetical protein [Achromobacter sp.]QCS61338.1 hypothetical protein EC609_01215 [Achromobacter denitrificans]WFC66628.1 hypothetical protein EUC41_10100 [Achromobacter denitrificans]